MAILLAEIGIGIEPDIRFSGPIPKLGSRVVLFTLPPNAPTEPSPACTAALALAHLAAVIATADGTISPDERQHLADHAEEALQTPLDDAVRVRMQAHFERVKTIEPTLAGVKSKVQAIPPERRAAIGAFLVDIAASV